MPTYRFLHRPTIQGWFDEFYDTVGVMHDLQTAPAKVALLFMVFAHARVYMPDNDRPGPSDLRSVLVGGVLASWTDSVKIATDNYLAAEHQLTREKGSIRLASVQARLNQCYYLLTQSRINHRWSLFGTISRLALAIGLNRSKRLDATNVMGQIEMECRRRTFWCAYTLDTFLSVALGRARSFHEEDIDAELPSRIEDDELTTDSADLPKTSKRHSLMLAPVEHIKLARIIGKILRNLYSIRPISPENRAAEVDRVSKELSKWRAGLARFLDADKISTSLLIPIFQRQRNVLNLTFWHAVILTHRPYILSSFTKVTAEDTSVMHKDQQTIASVQQCLTAAMHTVDTINDMTQNSQMFRAFWISAYFAFTANMVLYIYVIQKRRSPSDEYCDYFTAAVQCQANISKIAEKGSLSERHCLVLEELRAEAQRQINRAQAVIKKPEVVGADYSQNGITAPRIPPLDNNPAVFPDYADLMDDPIIDFTALPSSDLYDSSGWSQIASMVSMGLGNLDVFLNDDPFRL